MFKQFFKTVLIFTFSFLANSFYAQETFRVRKLLPFTLAASPNEEQTATIGINDSLALFFPEDLTYIEGIELKVQIPTEISSWRDSVACSIYDNIKPIPSAAQIDYSGNRIFVTPLPSKFN